MPRLERNEVNNFAELLQPPEFRDVADHSALKGNNYYVGYEVRILDALARMFSVLGPSTASFFYEDEMLRQKYLYMFSNNSSKPGKPLTHYGSFEIQQNVFTKLVGRASNEPALASKSLDELLTFLMQDTDLINDFLNNSKIYQSTKGTALDLKGSILDIKKLFSTIELLRHECFNELSITLKYFETRLNETSKILNNKNKSPQEKMAEYFRSTSLLVAEMVDRQLFDYLKKLGAECITTPRVIERISNFSDVVGEFTRPLVDLVKITLYAAKNDLNNFKIIECNDLHVESSPVSTNSYAFDDKDSIKKILKSHAELKGISTLWRQHPPILNYASEIESISIHSSTEYFGSSLLCCAECFVATSLTKKIGFRGTHSCYFNDAGDPMFLEQIDQNTRYRYGDIVSKLKLSKNSCSTADGYLSDDEDYTPSQLQQFIKQKAALTQTIDNEEMGDEYAEIKLDLIEQGEESNANPLLSHAIDDYCNEKTVTDNEDISMVTDFEVLELKCTGESFEE